jgi:ADP-heptose:LPS heptosyltransferase
MPKILVIRFSSIGDIVLTTPVLRCISRQVPDAEIHFLTKNAYTGLLEANPYVHRIHGIQKRVKEILPALQKEQFDYVIDLHNNLRSFMVKRSLRAPSSSFNKLNLYKWLMVKFKINKLPDLHIVDRYLAAARHLNIVNDGEGLDHFIPETTNDPLPLLPPAFADGFIAMVIGAQHATKQLPVTQFRKLIELISGNPAQSTVNIVLIGGPEDAATAGEIAKGFDNVANTCGKCSIQQSALLLQRAKKVITHDTGMMHIAAALDKRVISVWGNTIPEFGMYPYFGNKLSLQEQRRQQLIVENTSIGCRPCSKIGFQRCPKGHFNCMNALSMQQIADTVSLP